MVKNEGDIMSFQDMHSRDCSQVQRLASIYSLRSCSQSSGKRRRNSWEKGHVRLTEVIDYTRISGNNLLSTKNEVIIEPEVNARVEAIIESQVDARVESHY